MNAKQLSKFFSLQGYDVIKTNSCYWFNASPFFYQSIPYHRLISPSTAEIREILHNHRVLGLRYITKNDSIRPNSYVWVCDDKTYGYKNLRKSSRKRTRRSLKTSNIKLMEFSYLIDHGYPLILDTLKRQNRSQSSFTKTQWRSLCHAACKASDLEAWGAFVRDKLAAFAIAALIEDHYSILYRFSRSDLLHLSPNNALHFTIISQRICKDNVNAVFSGLAGLESNTGLDIYKSGMGFTKRSVCEKIVFKPLVSIFIGPLTYMILKRIVRFVPQSFFWRKAAGIAKVYTHTEC